ncbi:MAG: DNA repair protein RadC [Chitinophagales bacterium]
MEEHFKSLSLKNWAEDDRPREKLLLKGRNALSDAELLSILIGSGNAQETAVALAQRMLKTVNNNLIEFSKLPVAELKKFNGIGDVKALTIISAMELGRRRRGAEAAQKPLLQNSRDLYEFIQTFLSDLHHEEFVVVFLNRKLALIGHHRLSVGGQSGTVADTKIILKMAIEKMAASLVVAHNHPSGNVKPSQSDIVLTRNLKEACKLVDIVLQDHLILGENTYYSFADNGLL